MNLSANRQAVIRTHKLSPTMVDALVNRRVNDPKSGLHGVVLCGKSTEQALVTRGLIHRTQSRLTPLGVGVLSALTEEEPVAAKYMAPAGTKSMFNANELLAHTARRSGRTVAEAEPVAGVYRWDGAENPLAFLARVNRAFPEGSVVRGIDWKGVARTGVCLGVDTQYVTDPGHPNYRRSYTGVWWLDESGERLMGGRSRPFTDELVRI